MKKLNIILSAAAICALAVGCKSTAKTDATPAEADSIPATPAVSVVTGTVGDATSMNVLSVITANNDTLSFSISDAKDNDCIKGGFTIGEQVQVTYNSDASGDNMYTANSAVTLSVLYGDWTEPIPGGDVKGKQGIKIEKDGVASSINMNTLRYKSWAVDGCNLVLTSESEGSGAPTVSTDTMYIKTLSADSLILKGKNMELKYGKK